MDSKTRAAIAARLALSGLLVGATAHAGTPVPPVPPPPPPTPAPAQLPLGLASLPGFGPTYVTGFLTDWGFLIQDVAIATSIVGKGQYTGYFAPGHGALGTNRIAPLAVPQEIFQGTATRYPLYPADVQNLGATVFRGLDVFVATCYAGNCEPGARSLTDHLVSGGTRSATGPVAALEIDHTRGEVTVRDWAPTPDPEFMREYSLPKERAFATSTTNGRALDPTAVDRAGYTYVLKPDKLVPTREAGQTTRQLNELAEVGRRAGERSSGGAEPGGLDFNTSLMLGIASTRMAQNWIDRGSADPIEAIEFGALTYGAATVPAIGHGLGALFVADVAVNSYGRNSANLMNAMLNPSDPALRAAVRSGQIQADDFVPGLRGNPAYDAYAWFYDHAAARFAGVPLPARYNHPPAPRRDEWNDFVNGLKCLATQGCVGRRLGLNPGSSWGDPHVVTGDGLQYDFQAAGEFVLVEADHVLVQVRQQPQRGSQTVAFNTAVAARVGGHRVGVYALPSFRVLVDGQPQTTSVTLDGDGSVAIRDGTVAIAWAGGDTLGVQLRGDHLDIAPALTDDQRGKSRGLYGSLDGDRANDLALHDGTPLVLPVPFVTLYGAYADGWRITQDSSLFDYAPGETTATFTIAGFPAQHVSSASLTDEQRATAEAACRTAGVADAIRLESCILDVGTSGDPALAAGAASAPTPVESTADDPRPPGVATENFGGHIYAFVTVRRNIADADAFCRANGMTLASISSAEENAFLITAVRRHAGGEWFTGGKFSTTLGRFAWSDGTAFDFTAWHPGEPNNIGSFGNEDCVTLNRFAELTWNDSFCGAPSPFVCEVTP